MRHLQASSSVPSRLLPDWPIQPADDKGYAPANPRLRGPALHARIRSDDEDAGIGQRVRRILWIDDEFDRDNPLVRLLGFDGFGVEVAGSGAEGLVKAEAGLYDGIVLDLRLPDMFGLSVLKRLVAQGAAPVLVVTGYYHEPEMESEAIAAGAAAFRHKPLLDIEDLAAVLHSMTVRPVESKTAVAGSAPPDGIVIPEPAIPGTATLTVGPSSRRAQIVALSRELARPHLTSLEFVSTAGRLRRFLKRGPEPDRPSVLVEPLRDELRTVIQYLEYRVASGFLPREVDLESELGMHPGESGRLLTLHTGAGYREWRRALRLRPAVRALAFSDEHVRQIAFRIGYEHASQFDRDFHETFGLRPREYRRLLKEGFTLSRSPDNC